MSDEDLEQGLDDFESGVEDFDISPAVQPMQSSNLVASICRENRNAVQFFGFFAILFVSLVFLSLILIIAVPRQINTPAEWNTYRLPTWQKPVSYRLNMTSDFAASQLIGKATIRVLLSNVTDFIAIHADGKLKIRRAFFTVMPVVTPRPREEGNTRYVGQTFAVQSIRCNDTVQICAMQWSELATITRIAIDEDKTSADILLGIEWEAPLGSDMSGAYLSKYQEGDSEQSLVATQFESTFARAAFPCFDEPGLKATFSITLRSDASRPIVLANMPVIQTTTYPGGIENTFEASPKMSTYLVAFLVSKFMFVEESGTLGIPVRVYSRPDVYQDGKYAAEITARIIAAFNDFFALPYPLPKMDLVAVPDFSAGAMENWGLMTFRETALLYNPRESTTGSKERVATVVAHELAHQWFGDAVTMKWWNDVWLNEGFATFVEYVGVDVVHPEWNIWDLFVSQDLDRALYADSLASTIPVTKPNVNTQSDIESMFGAIIYSKGGSILRMLQYHVEAAKAGSFRAGLQDYLNTHKFANAQTSDLWDSLSKSSGKDVNRIMDTWTKNPGFPIIHISSDAGKLAFSQERFVINAGDPLTYAVPIRFVVDGVDSEVMLDSVSTTVSTAAFNNDKLLIVNRDRVGFYRVGYTPAMVARLLNDLSGSSNPQQKASDAIGLVQDLYQFSLAKNQYVPLNVTQLPEICAKMLPKFQSYAPVQVATEKLLRLGSRSNEETNMHAKVGQLLEPLITRIGPTVFESDSHDTLKLRAYLASVSVLIGNSFAQSLLGDFDRIKLGEYVHPDLRVASYRSAMTMETDEAKLLENFDFLLKVYRSTTGSSSDRSSALYALAYAKSMTILNKLLDVVLDENFVRQQDQISMLIRISRSNPRLSWDFCKSHYDSLKEHFGQQLFSFTSLIDNVAMNFATVPDKTDVETFLTTKEYPADKLAGILETIQSSIDWKAKYGDAIRAWVNK